MSYPCIYFSTLKTYNEAEVTMKTDIHGNITVTHINVRQSITLLLTKIMVTDFIAAMTIMTLFSALCHFAPNVSYTQRILSYNTSFFVFLGLMKILFTLYIILLWLNDYYEVMPEKVIHKSGVIWRTEQEYELEYVRTIKISQGLFGRIFDFGTIGLYDIRKNLVFDMYLIHDPHRYLHILEHLVKNPHEEKHIIRGHFFGEELDFEEKEENTQEKQLGKHFR